MGLILPQTIKIKIGSSNYQYYKEKGYTFKKRGDFIEVNVLDLPKRSKNMVKVVCDICGKEREMWYRTVVECNKEDKLITCGDKICERKKREDTCMKKYGVKNVFQLQETKDKIVETNNEKYGADWYTQTKEYKDKSKKTCQLHYGVDNPAQAQEVKDAMKDTCRNKYGCDYAVQSDEVQNKIKSTNNKIYGGDSPFSSEEIRKKSQQTWQENYGEDIINPGQAQEVKDKIKATWKNNYGEDITSPFQVESIKEKSQQTWQKNYGENITNPGQAQEVKDKIRATLQKNYGEDITCSFQVESVREKSKQTMLNNYGVEYALQNEDIKNKVLDSYQFNHTGPSSRAQRYINHILNGTLNKRICGSLADIYIEKENIIIEHDGGGHFLGDKMNGNAFPTKESLLYEKEREDKIINNGYRMIRFIANKDRIPSDEVILNLVEGFKNSDFKVIRINFEEGTIDRDYDEKWYCNFGKLRKITKEDLEKFKKQEENTSEN